MLIRKENPNDAAAIHAVHAAAFPSNAEAGLVDRLRTGRRLTISLVAIIEGCVAGHIAFSPVEVVSSSGEVCGGGLGLAPVAVLPEYQRRGVGSALIARGLDECTARGEALIVVLGHPAYYARFGFRPASEFGLDNEYGATDAFMALRLSGADDAPPLAPGLVRYAPEFAQMEC